MMDLVFVTGNQAKADYLAQWLGRVVEHQKVDIDEIQSLDPIRVLQEKARSAYEIVQRPVLVEDVSLTFTAMGHLPGTLIKWFLEELGVEKLASLAQKLPDQHAVASITYGIFDGLKLVTFSGEAKGVIVPKPRGKSFGWNTIFMPDGFTKTYAEMTPEEFHTHSHRGIALRKMQTYLKTLE